MNHPKTRAVAAMITVIKWTSLLLFVYFCAHLIAIADKGDLQAVVVFGLTAINLNNAIKLSFLEEQ